MQKPHSNLNGELAQCFDDLEDVLNYLRYIRYCLEANVPLPSTTPTFDPLKTFGKYC